MKISFWLSLTALMTGSALAQPAAVPAPTPTPAGAPPTPLVDTNIAVPAKTLAPAQTKTVEKPAAKKPAAKKPAAKKPDLASTVRSEPLIPGPATVVASNVNVRGQAKYTSEIVTRVTKGDKVTVIEEIQLKNSKPDEPSAWAKIVLPSKAHAWVHSQFVDATNKTVIPKKLNIRSGPGENYSVIGTLQKGDAVKEVETKENWIKIEAPANAFAFIAAAYLKNDLPAAPVEPAPTPTEIAETKPIAPAPTETPSVSPETPTPPVAPTPEAVAKAEEPPPKRIVQREGIVRGSVSIQAPTHYSLISPDTGKAINYLYTTSRYLDLSRYKGLRIVVTGEEGLDERWPNTPVITIQKIQVLE